MEYTPNPTPPTRRRTRPFASNTAVHLRSTHGANCVYTWRLIANVLPSGCRRRTWAILKGDEFGRFFDRSHLTPCRRSRCAARCCSTPLPPPSNLGHTG
ncbi:hypothetical protein NL676_023120 [Syzygium grande]|nr:hypothetical protein NL676_023120 [Syzygium grande]